MVEELFEGWSEPLPFVVSPGSADNQVTTKECRVVGWSLRESTGSANAALEFYDGPSEAAQIIGTVGLAQGMSDTQHLAEGGVRCRRGLFVEMITGSITGAVWLRLRE